MTISRRDFLVAGVAAGAAVRVDASVLGRPVGASHITPQDLHERSPVIDGCGVPGSAELEPGAPLSPQMLTDIRESGVTGMNLTIGGVGTQPSLQAFEAIIRDLARWDREVRSHPEVFARVESVSDLSAATEAGRLGLIFGLQDGVAFEDDLSRLDVLAQLGVRIVQLTYNQRNLIGDGCLESDDAGLSRAGRAAVERLNGLQLLIDLSHCGRRTTLDALAASSQPVAFTHTGCAAIYDHPRSKTDAQLRALAEKGGVAGIYFMPYLRPSGQAMAEDVIRHIEHAVQVAGEDHVGIGTDLEMSPVVLTPAFVKTHREVTQARIRTGIAAPGDAEDVYLFVPDLNFPRRLLSLADLLLKRGHPASRVEKILGGNFVRLFTEVWG